MPKKEKPKPQPITEKQFDEVLKTVLKPKPDKESGSQSG